MIKKYALACEMCGTKNYHVKKSISERLKLNKYCSRCKEHTLHKEEK
ncbi:50S ribosomal protein L33 [[Mycoplasma] mobile]|nr:50S ribosomal protein L33 [[Mycoplasma] mobile]